MAIGVGVIGLGMAVTPHMSALRDLDRDGRVRIVGGHAPSEAGCAAFAATSQMPAFATPDALLAVPGFDLVLVLTPSGTHLPVAQIAGTRGSAVLAASRPELHGSDGPPEIIDGGVYGGGGADPMAFDPGSHRALIGEMLDAIEQNRDPPNNAGTALPAQRLIEAILADSERQS